MEVLVLFAIGGAALGFVIGRWWALLAAFLIPLVYINAGVDADGTPEWMWALVLLTPPALLGLAVGIGTRRFSARRT